MLFPIIYLFGKVNKYLPKHDNKKILIIHFGGIGDVLMSTPAIRLLRKCYPNSKINYIVSDRTAINILKRNPDINEFQFFQQNKDGNIKNIFFNCNGVMHGKLKLYFCYPLFIINNLFKGFDIGISFGNFKDAGTFSTLFYDLIGAKESFGCFGDYPELLTTKINNSLLEKHWTDIYIGIVADLLEATIDIENDFSMSYEISNYEKELINKDLNQKNISDHSMISIVHPGGNDTARFWDYKKFAAVADHLYTKYNMIIFITGSKGELHLANLVSEKMNSPSIIVAGEYSFTMVAALLQKAKLCITNDTSILHLADAVETDVIISLWGPTNYKKSGPRNHRNIFIISELECSPCYFPLHANEELIECDQLIKEECLKIIDTKKVIDRIDDALINIGQ